MLGLLRTTVQHHHPRIPSPFEWSLGNQFPWQVIIIIAQRPAHRWIIREFAAARKILDDRARMNAPGLDLAIAALEKIRQTSDRAPRASKTALARLQFVAPNKADLLAPIRERVRVCTKCPHLACSRTQTVFGVGNPNAELMFIGEAPGVDEDKQGEPFVGRAGQLLTRIIETMGLSRAEVYIANILKCRPDMPKGTPGNRPPTPQEMQTCIGYPIEQIEIIQPRVMVALGATAVEGLPGG